MKAILEIQSENNAGRKMWLRTGQLIKVGRTEQAQFVISDDGHMSALHFALVCASEECRIRDLGSANGTFLNGHRIEDAILVDGDQVVAGQTKFLAHLLNNDELNAPPQVHGDETGLPSSGGEPSDSFPVRISDEQSAELADVEAETSSERLIKQAHGMAEMAAIRHADETGHPEFVKETCFSGMTLFRGSPPFQPVDVARRCAKSFPLFLVVDFVKAGLPIPADLSRLHYLYDWLPGEILAESSPLVVSAKDTSEIFSLLENGWGKDGLICLYSNEEKSVLLDHLRSMVRYYAPDSEPADQGSVLAYAWPTILAPLLAHGESEFTTLISSRVDAFLLEGQMPDSWQLFGQSELEKNLQQMGFIQTDPKTKAGHSPKS